MRDATESSQDCGKHATQQRRINQRACSRRFRQSADSFSQNHRFLAVFTQWVCSLASTPPKVAASPPPNGGNGIIRGVTRRRHAGSQFLMLQNPHRQPASCATSPTRPGRRADWREKTRPTPPLQPRSAKKLARHAINRQFWAIVRAQGELLRARIHHQTQQGEKCRTLGMETRAS